MEYKKIGEKEFLSLKDAAQLFGRSDTVFKRDLAEQKVLVAQYGRWFYIPKELIEKWQKEKEELIEFGDFISYLIKKTDSNYPDDASTRRYERTYCSGYNFWGVQVYKRLPYMDHSYNQWYINKKDIPILEEQLKERFFLYKKEPEVKLNYLLGLEFFKKYKKTAKYIKECFDKLHEIRKLSYVEMTNFLRQTMTKELMAYSESEILDYVKLATEKLSKRGCENFVELYNYIQGYEKCNPTTQLKFDRHMNEGTVDSEPYIMEDFMKMAYLIFNPIHWKNENMLEKATSNYRLARMWLNHAMQFICAWRKSDIISKLPRVELPDKPEKILEKIKNEMISENEYKQVAFYVEAYVNMKAEKPKKRRRIQSSSQVHLSIPDCLASTIGMLFMMCEAHARINNVEGAFNHFSEVDAENCSKLFGEKYAEVLEGKCFGNRKANKAYMRMLQDTEESSIKGYILAAYARSHTMGIEKLPEVTSRYLKAKLDHYSVDEITRTLFERGTCSFIPYLLCEYLDNEFKEKSMPEQTEIIKQLPYTPNEIETILTLDEKLEIKVKEKIKEIIKWGNEDNLYEMIRDALEDIASGKCTGKTTGIYCIRKACKKECCEKNRETCVGCGNEMYVRGFLHELNNEINEQKEKLNNAETKAEYIKRSALLKERLYPAVIEVLTVMKYTYGQNIEEYKTMLLDELEEDKEN